MMPNVLTTEIQSIEERKQVAARGRFIAQNNGHGHVTPSQWFENRFPGLRDKYGDAVLEDINKHGIVLVAGLNEDYLAATLGEGAPDAPTVFVPTESRFYTYSQDDGIFNVQRESPLQARLSGLLLDCARACKGDACETQALGHLRKPGVCLKFRMISFQPI